MTSSTQDTNAEAEYTAALTDLQLEVEQAKRHPSYVPNLLNGVDAALQRLQVADFYQRMRDDHAARADASPAAEQPSPTDAEPAQPPAPASVDQVKPGRPS